jgi:catechol 2,3-dioxygenase-like lactoylglutathione lyase family enzyme
MKLDHYTLRTRNPEETVRFYTEYLGLKEGWRQGFNFPGHLL